MIRIFQILLVLLLPNVVTADLRSAHRAFESGNYKSAFVQLLPLAESGNVEAQSNLAWLYRNGAGTEQNNVSAAKWYRLAAEQGDAYAQFNYAKMCEQGLGTQQSDEEAVLWYRKAAMQGQANAQFSLGEMYLDGAGVEQDFVRAYAWVHVVVGSGIEAAESVLEEMELEMSSEELQKARKLGQELWDKYGSDPDQVYKGDKSIKGTLPFNLTLLKGSVPFKKYS